MELSPLEEVHPDELLERTLDTGYRELQLRSGEVAAARRGAEYGRLSEYGVASSLQVQQMVYALLTDGQIGDFERTGTLDFVYPLRRRATFDVRLTHDGAVIEAVFIRTAGE